MQPDPEQPPKRLLTPEERRATLSTARYWYDTLKKGTSNVPEAAKENIDGCLVRLGIGLKEMLGSEKGDEELEKELQEDIKKSEPPRAIAARAASRSPHRVSPAVWSR